MEQTDSNLDYALRAIQDPRLRNTEEFSTWIRQEGNKELFRELMACREAVMREQLARAQKKRVRMRIVYGAVAAAAVFMGVVLFSGLLTFSVGTQKQPIRLFAANDNPDGVTLQVDNQSQTLVEDSMMDVNEWKKQAVAGVDTVKTLTLTTPRGRDFTLVLSDGTKVWMNAESTLRYPLAFNGKERSVELIGEACFQVAKDKEHPFIVRADGLETKVLGTKFNVRSYKNEERHVTLVNGRVQVNHAGNNILLNPGEDLTCTCDGRTKVDAVNIAAYTAWTEGLFYFEDMPLERIMQSLGRWYNVNIDFEDQALYSIKINFWADRNSSLEETLRLMNKLRSVRVEYQSGTILVKHT